MLPLAWCEESQLDQLGEWIPACAGMTELAGRPPSSAACSFFIGLLAGGGGFCLCPWSASGSVGVEALIIAGSDPYFVAGVGVETGEGDRVGRPPRVHVALIYWPGLDCNPAYQSTGLPVYRSTTHWRPPSTGHRSYPKHLWRYIGWHPPQWANPYQARAPSTARSATQQQA